MGWLSAEMKEAMKRSLEDIRVKDDGVIDVSSDEDRRGSSSSSSSSGGVRRN